MQKKKKYVKPKIVYKDVLKTRAGSPLSTKRDRSDPFDPANIFNND
jgi:hypothetical protein